MTLSNLKLFFRTVIKVVAGGPVVGTPGANRAAGVLQALDQLAEFAAEAGSRYVQVDANGNLVVGSPDNSNAITGGQFGVILNGAFNEIHDGETNAIFNSNTSVIAGGNGNAIYGGYSNTIPASCTSVSLFACSNFTVPAGTTDAMYRNNELVQAGGTSTPLRDIYDVPEAVRTTVAAGNYGASGPDYAELQDPTPAGSEPGMRFKAGQAIHEYMRGSLGNLVWVRWPAG